MDIPSFKEEQKFNQVWIWIIVIACDLLVVSIFGIGLYKQFLLNQPFGDNPMPNGVLILFSAIFISMMVLITFLLMKMKLVIELRTDVLFVSFFPFIKKQIPYNEITSAQAITYRPILEYGGWGIRYGFRGKAYNVSGNKGVKLFFNNGKHLLLGSQNSEELAEKLNEKLRNYTIKF